MKMKTFFRCLVLMLCLVLAISVFAACNTGNGNETTGAGTEGSPTEGENTTGAPGTETPSGNATVKLTEYSVLVPELASDEESAAAALLMIAAQEKLGGEFKYTGSDFVTNPAEIDPNAYEILVGAPNRPESATALQELNGQIGFVVKLIGNKIVINATSLGLLDEAAQYFVTEYMEKGANGEFTVPTTLLYTEISSGVSLVDTAKGEFRYSFVYSDSLDTTEGSSDGDRTDYVVTFFMPLRNALLSATDLIDVTFDTDRSNNNAAACEVLMGRTNRAETQTFLATLKPNEYGYAVVGNKLVISGWSDYTIGLALQLFKDDFANYLVEENGMNNIVLTETDRVVKAYEPWNVDVPLFDASKLSGVAELINNGYLAYYTNTSPEEYKAYVQTVTAAGYKLHQENQIGNNLYSTFTNGKTMMHAYYTEYENSIRVVVESTKTAILPANTSKLGEKVTDLTMTLFDFDTAAGNWGNCFIITLEDGSFILHDGGADKGGKDCLELWNLLNKLNKREDGKVVIAAWIISHQHYDHFKNAYDLMTRYYNKGLVLEKLVFNVPSPSIEYNSNNPGSYWKNGNFNRVKQLTGCELVVLHTGQKLSVHGSVLEIMYTCDDIYPLPPEKFNNSAFIVRMGVGEGENYQTVTILGDAEEVASKIMVKMHGENMKTDICSVAHHSWGGSVELYAVCKPSVVIWPIHQSTVNEQLSGTGYYPTINQSLANQSNVKMIVVGDFGHRTFKMPVLGLTGTRAENLANLVTVWPREDGLKY